MQIKDADGDDQYLVVNVQPDRMFSVKELLDPIVDYYDADIIVDEDDGEFLLVSLKSAAQYDAMTEILDLSDFSEISTKSLIGQASAESFEERKSLCEIESAASRYGTVVDSGYSAKHDMYVVGVLDENNVSWDTIWLCNGTLDGMIRND